MERAHLLHLDLLDRADGRTNEMLPDAAEALFSFLHLILNRIFSSADPESDSIKRGWQIQAAAEQIIPHFNNLILQLDRVMASVNEDLSGTDSDGVNIQTFDLDPEGLPT